MPGPCNQPIRITVNAQVCSTTFSRKIAVLHTKCEICENRNDLCFPSAIPPNGGNTNGSQCERLPIQISGQIDTNVGEGDLGTHHIVLGEAVAYRDIDDPYCLD